MAICICGCMCMTECACVRVEWFIWWLDICGFSWPVKCVCAHAHTHVSTGVHALTVSSIRTSEGF